MRRVVVSTEVLDHHQSQRGSERRGRRETPRGRRAFTLAEVLVVMAIIATLVALLSPALGTVRDSTQQAECQSNLRQIGAAIEVYRQKNDRLLPRCAPLPSNDPFADPDGLPGALRHIIDPASRVWWCPADHLHEADGTDIPASHFYVAGAFMLFQPPNPFPAARQITQFFETDGSNIPIVWDSADRHPIGTDLPRNGLYIDGRVERVGEPFSIPGE